MRTEAAKLLTFLEVDRKETRMYRRHYRVMDCSSLSKQPPQRRRRESLDFFLELLVTSCRANKHTEPDNTKPKSWIEQEHTNKQASKQANKQTSKQALPEPHDP